MWKFFRRIRWTKPVVLGIVLRGGPLKSAGLDDLSRAPDSGIGYSQDHRRQWARDNWVEQDSSHPTGSQLMGLKRQAGDRLATSLYADDVVRQRENRWNTPRKRALFGLDGPDSMTSGSDVVEGQDYGPPDDSYPMVGQSGLFIENDYPREA